MKMFRQFAYTYLKFHNKNNDYCTLSDKIFYHYIIVSFVLLLLPIFMSRHL